MSHALHGGPSGSAEDALVKLDFSVSLNAFGPSPEVANAARSAPLDQYPDPRSVAVRNAAATKWNIDADNIAFGAGASELLHALTLAYLTQGDHVVIAEPTFGEYRHAAELRGAIVHGVMSTKAPFALDVDRLIATVLEIRPKLTFLCTPNNPTGETLTRDPIDTVTVACETTGSLLVVDQSFDAFSDNPLGSPVLTGHPKRIWMRSITKEHALAGVRTGFAIADAAIINTIEAVRPPWPTSTVAQAAAGTSFSEPAMSHATRTITQLQQERRHLETAFAALGITTIPTSTHYFLAHLGDRVAAVRNDLLKLHGIRVRDCTSFGLPQYIRVAARTPHENKQLVDAITSVYS